MTTINRDTRLASKEFKQRVGGHVWGAVWNIHNSYGPWPHMKSEDRNHATIEDLATLTEEDLVSVRGMGKKAIAKLTEVLKEQGLDWGHAKPRPIVKPWVGLSDQRTVAQLLYEAAECLRLAAVKMAADD